MRRGALGTVLVLGLVAVLWLWSSAPRESTVAAGVPDAPLESSAPGAVSRAPGGPVREPATRPLAPVGPPRSVEEPVASASPALRVRFVDRDANPVAQVELRDAARPLSSVAADRGGVATFVLRDARAPLDLVARSPGFATAHRWLPTVPIEETWLEDWALMPAGAVAGRVLDEDDVPLGGVRIGVAEEGVPRPGPSAEWEGTISAADGAFELAALPAGPRRLVARIEGREPGLSEVLEVPRAGRLDGVEIRMPPAGSGTAVSGVVLDPSGEPVAGARVEAAAGNSTYAVLTDAAGAFRFDPGRRVRCRLVATDPRSRHGEAVLADVPAGRGGIELRLAEVATLTLVVRGEGAPVVDFWALALDGDDQVLATVYPEERPDGRASFARPTSRFRVEVRANGWRPGILGPFEPGDSNATIECTLEPASGVGGRVLRGDVALGGATVTLHPARTTEATTNGFPVRSDWNPWNRTRSAADGTFALSVEEPGDYYVRAEAEGLAPAEVGPLALDPDVEHEADLVLGPGGALAVRVRSSEGRGVAGTLVALSRGDGGARTWRCDGNGELHVDTLTPGPWQVELAGSEIDPRFGATQLGTGPVRAIPANCTVREGTTTRVDLWLEDRGSKSCRLNGRFTLDGEPASGFRASLLHGSTAQAPVPFTEDGVFRLVADEPGPCGLMLVPDTLDPLRVLLVRDTVELFEGDAHWSVELETGVLDAASPASASFDEDLQLYLRWSSGTLEVFVPLQPDADGRLHHERVPLGPARLVQIRADQLLEAQTPIDLGALEATPR